jgi:hypothetical protein
MVLHVPQSISGAATAPTLVEEEGRGPAGAASRGGDAHRGRGRRVGEGRRVG